MPSLWAVCNGTQKGLTRAWLTEISVFAPWGYGLAPRQRLAVNAGKFALILSRGTNSSCTCKACTWAASPTGLIKPRAAAKFPPPLPAANAQNAKQYNHRLKAAAAIHCWHWKLPLSLMSRSLRLLQSLLKRAATAL